MSDAETQSALPPALSEDQPQPERTVIATLVQGTVKWFNVRNGYGFINRNDTKEDVFVHQTAIKKNNPRKFLRSVGDGEIVEFDVVEATKGSEAANVTGPGGVPVKGSRYAPNKRRFRRRFFPRGPRPGQADGGEPPSGPKADEEGGGENDGSVPQPVPRRRRPRRRPDVQGGTEAEEQKNGEVVGGEVVVQQKVAPRRFRPQYRRPFRPRPPPGERVAGQQLLPTVLAEVQARPTEEGEEAQKPGQAEGAPSDGQLVKPRRQFSRRRQRSSESTPSKDGLDKQPEPDLPVQVIKPPDPKSSPKASPKSSPKMPPKTIKQSEVPATTVTEPSE